MTRGHRLHRCASPLFLLAGLSIASGGCVRGSLASDTGPRPPAWQWSTARRQMVHVGEQVRFDFVLQDAFGRFVHPLGLADYCTVGIGEEHIETTADAAGHFQFMYRFDQERPGDQVDVKATAYRQRGGRDFMKVRSQWLKSDSPYEIADRKVATDSIRFTVYEATIDLTLVKPAHDLEPESGILRIRRTDGATTSVYIDQPGRPGFTLSGPDADQRYRIRYRPKGNELNPTGTTEVDLTIYDRSGNEHDVSISLETP